MRGKKGERGDPQGIYGFRPLPGVATGPAASDGLSGLGGMADLGLSLAGGFSFLVLGVFRVFFWVVRRRQYPEVRIRSSLAYPCFGGAPSASRGHVESCVWLIFSDLFGFCYRLCGFSEGNMPERQ
jgi:hypothetical protein